MKQEVRGKEPSKQASKETKIKEIRLLYILPLYILLHPLTSYAVSQNVFLSGYLKSLDFLSKDTQTKAWETLSGNRFRLDGQWQALQGSIGARVISDHEFLYGGLLASQQKAVNANLAQDEFSDLNWTLNQKENLIWRHSLYRAYLHGKHERVDMVVGRQRTAWGQGRLWNPVDVIDPYNPLSVEREERSGSDALLLRFNFTALSFLETVYVPRRKFEWERSLILSRARLHIFETDLSFLGGKAADENMAGLEQASQVWEGSLRSETSYVFDSNVRRDFFKAVLSYDYSFSLTHPLYLLGEFFYNGIGERNSKNYPSVILRQNDQRFLGKDYLGFGLNYEWTPLWKSDCFGIVNLDDGSAFLGPKITWQPLTDFEIGMGYQAFVGSGNSEYGSVQDVAFLQIQWYFTVR